MKPEHGCSGSPRPSTAKEEAQRTTGILGKLRSARTADAVTFCTRELRKNYRQHYNWPLPLTLVLGLAQSVIGFELTSRQRRDLVAFLKTLTDREFIEDQRFSDPFRPLLSSRLTLSQPTVIVTH